MKSVRVRCKVCCIADPGEASLAIAHGADALGLVGKMPSGPGVIDDQQIAAIAATLPPAVASFLLTSETDADAIVDHVRRVNASTVQIVDTVEPDVYAALRRALPAVKIVQVLHVEDEAVLAEAAAVAPHVDGILLDSGRPNAAVRELGGTGRVHDWELSAAVVEQTNRPVFLAGGLHADNVVEAVTQVRPYGVDICSGVRTDGRLDPQRLAAFMFALRSVSR